MTSVKTLVQVGGSLITTLVLAACASSPPSASWHQSPFGSVAEPTIPIFGRWKVISIAATGRPSAPAFANPFIQFNRNGTVVGFDGVNNVGGDFGFTVHGQGLELSQVTSTLVGIGGRVPIPLQESQTAFATMASGKAIPYRIAGNRLVLVCGNLVLTSVRE